MPELHIYSTRIREESNNWGQVKKITADDAAANDHFGMSVSISTTYVIVGAKDQDVGGTDRGDAYIF